MSEKPECSAADSETAATEAPSRRAVLGSAAGLFGSMAALSFASSSAAQAAQEAGELQRLVTARRILIKSGIVLTLDPGLGDFAQADVLIEDGRIAAIRPAIAPPADAIIVDGANRILVSGFVDTHTHAYQGLLRGIIANGLLEPDYNRDIQNNLTLHYSADEVYAGVLVTALGLLATGTTCIVDLSQISHTPEHSDACIKALQDSGIRAVYSYSRGAGANARWPQDIARLQRTYFNSKDQLLTLALTGNLTAPLLTAGRAAGVRVIQHLPGADVSAQLLEFNRAGLMRPGDEYIHCLGINDAAWRVLKDSGASVSLCPPIEMAMGHGTPAIQTALDHGLRPTLSSDSAVVLTEDMFTLMRATTGVQRLFVLQRARSGERDLPALLTCRDVLEFATIEGARCADLASKIGTLSVGKDADILMLKADALDVWPLNNAAGAVVNLMNPGHVESVFVAGKARKWRGALVGVDVPRVTALVAQARESLLKRAGYRTDLLG